MKNLHWLKNLILVFWFGWFALAGIGITFLLGWLFPSLNNLPVMETGSTIGIITGGLTIFVIYLISCRNNGKVVFRNFHFPAVFQ